MPSIEQLAMIKQAVINQAKKAENKLRTYVDISDVIEEDDEVQPLNFEQDE